MKPVLLFFAFVICTARGMAQETTVNRSIEVLPESTISIHGDAKIAEFTCNFDIGHLQEPAQVSYNKTGSTIDFQDVQLIIENRGFDCGSRGRNEDFHEMVKTEEYPEMRLTLRKATLEDGNTTATADIFIAGRENRYTIPVEVNEDVSRFRGKFEINIRDFDLEPITKMFGLVRVQDIIEIRFDLRVKYSNRNKPAIDQSNEDPDHSPEGKN